MTQTLFRPASLRERALVALGLAPRQATQDALSVRGGRPDAADPAASADGSPTAEVAGLYAFATEPHATYQYLIALDEPSASDVSGPIQIAKIGRFKHPAYGEFAITAADLQRMAANFKANVRKIALAVDVNHDPDHAAVGWFRDVEARGDALWATVEWTPEGQQLLKEGTYRYFSPEFAPNYQDAESGQSYGATLLGGALTNRPFLKGMEPVKLAEAEAAVALDDGGGSMGADYQCDDPADAHMAVMRAVRHDLIVAQGANDFPTARTAVSAALAALNAYMDGCDADPTEPDADDMTGGDQSNPVPANLVAPLAMSERSDPEMTDPQTPAQPAAPNTLSPEREALLLADNATMNRKLAEVELALTEARREARTARITGRVEKLVSPDESGTIRLTPGQRDGFLSLVLTLSEEQAEAFIKLQEANPGFKLGAIGSDATPTPGVNPSEKLEGMIAALAEEKGINLAEATDQIIKRHPDLYEQHRKSAAVRV